MDLFKNGKIDWSHPLIVVPAAVAALGVVTAPFAIWSGAQAAQFFGYAISSAAAVLAVIVTSNLTAKRDRARDDRTRERGNLSAARIARAELRSIVSYLNGARQFLPLTGRTADPTEQLGPVDPTTDAFVTLRAIAIKVSTMPQIDNSLMTLCDIDGVADPLMDFRSNAASLLQSVTNMSDLHLAGRTMKADWGHFRVVFWLIDISTKKAINALTAFIDAHENGAS